MEKIFKKHLTNKYTSVIINISNKEREELIYDGKDLLVLYNGAEIDFYCDFSDYREDMTHKGNGDLDIIKVYNVGNPYMLNVTHNHNASCENELIFMADIMTKADAEKKFGIRIID